MKCFLMLVFNLEKYLEKDNKKTLRYTKPVETNVNIIKSDLKELQILDNEIEQLEDTERFINFLNAEIDYYAMCIKIYTLNDIIILSNNIFKITEEHITEAKKVKKELHNIKRKLNKKRGK